MMEVMKIMVTSFRMSHACTAIVHAPNPVSGHHWPTPQPETPGYSRASLGQSLVGPVLLSPGSWCPQGLCPPRLCSPVLCKFWWLCGGVNGDLLQEAAGGLCHTQVCCTQSRCPCGGPLLTPTSTGGTQTHCVSLCGVSGCWCARGLFEPSENFWQVWDLILKATLPLLPSCWGLFFVFVGIFSQSLECHSVTALAPTMWGTCIYPSLKHLNSPASFLPHLLFLSFSFSVCSFLSSQFVYIYVCLYAYLYIYILWTIWE